MQHKQMTLFDVMRQVKLDQWLILSTCIELHFLPILSNLPHPQINIEEETSNFGWSESFMACTESP